MTDWNLQDAKNRFSAVVREALAGYPQHVSRRGKPAVVVLAEAEYERLRRLEVANAPSLADMLLAVPRDNEEFQRLAADPRPVAFGASTSARTPRPAEPPRVDS